MRKYLVPKLILLPPIQLVSEQKTKLSPIEVQAKDKYFNDKIRNAIQNLHDSVVEEENSEFYKNLHGFRKRQINDIADALKGKIEIGTLDIRLDYIAIEIREMLRNERFSPGIITHVTRYLPKEFVRNYGISQLANSIEYIISVQLSDLEVWGPERLRQYVQGAIKAINDLKDHTKHQTNNLEFNIDKAVELALIKFGVVIPGRDKKEEDDVIRSEHLDPKKGKAWNACIEVYNSFIENDYEYSKAWKKLADKLDKYPPGEKIDGETVLNKEDDAEIARFLLGKKQSIMSDFRMLKSLIDDKYAFSLDHWFKVIVDEDNYGKHAAAVMNKINPKGSTTKPRPLTRERVGDTKENYWEYMKKQAEAMGYDCWWKGVAEIWDEKYHAPYNADRRNREGPKLSETAFGSSSDEHHKDYS